MQLPDSEPDHNNTAQGKKKTSQDGLAEWYRLAGLGFEFVAAILIMGGLGWFVDSRLGTKPWLLVVGFGLGFALGLWLLLREARRAFHD